MADNFGVLGSSTAVAVGPVTVYTCPANKAAKFKLFFSASSTATPNNFSVAVNGITVAGVVMPASNTAFTNGGAGLSRAPAAGGPTGVSAAETAQPGPPIYYLSAGQTVTYIVGAAALAAMNFQVVGIEVDLTL
jgi:hypothetical protein